MDLNAARELFETSQDLTVGIEEEWAIIDPQTLELVPKYEALRAAHPSRWARKRARWHYLQRVMVHGSTET